MMSVDSDALARRLSAFGRIGAAMPRGAFEAQGDAHPVYAGPHRIGKILPGIGLVLDADAKRLGLTRQPRHVFDRTPFMRNLERAVRTGEGAITSRAAIATAYAATKAQTVYNDPTLYLGLDVSGAWFFSFDTVRTANFASPGTTCNRSSPPNAFNALMSDPPSGQTQYLVGVSAMLNGTSVTNNGFAMMIIMDILAQSGAAFDWSTSVGPFSYSTPALTRYTSGVGVYMTLIPQQNNQAQYNALTTVSISYHNQANSSKATSFTSSSGQTYGEAPNDLNVTLGSNPFISLASGDYGVRSLDSVTLSGALNNTSNGLVGALLFHPHVFVQPIVDLGITVERDAATEPEKLLCVLPTESGGTLGYIGACYCVSGTNAGFGPSAQIVTVTLDTCWG